MGNDDSLRGPSAAQRRLLSMLDGLFDIQASELDQELMQASDLVARALGTDKVDAFLYDPALGALIAVGTSDTPMSRRQKEIGMDRLPIAEDGGIVGVYDTGTPYIIGHADRDSRELAGLTQGLGVRSIIALPLTMGDTRRGVLAAFSARPNKFSTTDLGLLEAAAR